MRASSVRNTFKAMTIRQNQFTQQSGLHEGVYIRQNNDCYTHMV